MRDYVSVCHFFFGGEEGLSVNAWVSMKKAQVDDMEHTCCVTSLAFVVVVFVVEVVDMARPSLRMNWHIPGAPCNGARPRNAKNDAFRVKRA